ncbi:MAG: hypothetical protein JWN56_1575 [Sphingobacteriales bacterium]|nr:hypothetical protein [Sphingobacteriales bacterium]
MIHEFRKYNTNEETSVDVKLLNDLCRIYSAENYCLRRIPRLVNLIESPSLASLLSDHVSKIMDRLNLLDEIFGKYKTRPSTLKVFMDSPSHSMRIFLLKDDKGNQKLITELIKASQYRYSLYELLLNSSNQKVQTTIYAMLVNSLNEEEKFYQELLSIKRQILLNIKTATNQIIESA